MGCDTSKRCNNLLRNFHRPTQDIGLPDPQDGPAGLAQHARLLTVTLNVPPNLRDPVRRVVTSAELRQPVLQIAPMPEVPIAEDHEAMPGEHDVRATRQPGNVEAVAVAATPELTPESKLATRVRLHAGTSCGH